MARAEAQSGRLADRWAPEGPRAAHSPAMRSLGFADRVIGSYLGEGVQRPRRSAPVERPVAPMDWLFPVPWYLDELDWLSAGRAAAWESQRAALRSGEMSAPPRAAMPAVSERSRPAASPPPEAAVRYDLPLELVAPALAASRASERGTPSPARVAAPALRAFAPGVDATAARAAEFLAELLARNAASASASARAGGGAEMVETAFRPAPILEYVAPAELVASSEEAPRSQIAWAARETLQAARQAELIAEERARIAARSQAIAGARPRTETASGQGGGEVARLEAVRAEEATRLAAAQAEVSRVEAARAEEIRAEVVRADAARTEVLTDAVRAEAVRSEAARSEAIRAEAARAEAGRQMAPAAPSRRAVELLAAGALAGDAARMSLSAGPRVVLPAGLGGLIAAADQSRAVHQPVAAPAAMRRARSGSRGVQAPLATATARPAAIDHLVWSDRWLARFAGASTSALVSFDMARGAPAVRPGAAAEWQPAWVTSSQPRPRGSLPSAAAAAPERVLTAASIVDENQPVGDDVLAAIASAAATDRSARQRPSRPKPPGPAAPRGPFRPSAADRSLARISMPASAGLRPALGASPVAAVLSTLVGATTQAPFDARPLSLGSVSEFLARGASATRAITPLPSQLIAQRAPGATWLALAPDRAADPARGPLRSVGGRPADGRIPVSAALREAPALSLVAPDPTQAADTRATDTSSATAAARAAEATTSSPARQALLAARSPAREAMQASPSAWLGSALSARPGALAAGAEGFASTRSAAAADLSLDFLSPEVLVAARSFGFSPVEALRAQRLAAAGRPELTRLASLVDQVFVSALSPTGSGERERAAGPGGAASFSASELAQLTPQRMPRGSFLMPSASSRALGVTAGQAEREQPGIAAALELVAAGQVAEVAEGAARRPAATGAPSWPISDSGGASPASAEAVSRDQARHRGEHMREVAQERAATEAARDLLPRHLWSVFDAVYLSLGEETVASDVRPLGPAARAARALALASRARSPEDLPLSARARAAAAWAVLPAVMTGGVSAPRAGAPGRAPRPAPTFSASYAAGGEGETATGAPRRPSGASRAGEALASLVAPSFFRGDDRGDGYAPISGERARSSMPTTTPTFVETGSRERPAPPPRSEPPPRPAPRPAPAASPEPSRKEFEAWFQSAAQKYFGEAPSASGLTIAEMTLVTSAPREQIAASEATAMHTTGTQFMAGAATGGAEGGGGPGGGAPPNIDKIAQDVYDQIVRMLAVARERSGDPWNR